MLFRRFANPASAPWNVAKTLVALAAFWLVFLYAIPKGIVFAQDFAELGELTFPPQREAAAVVFGLGLLVYLWSGLSLAIVGRGTPLPFDAPRQMVVSGPYRWMRNPMVTSILVQGVGEVLYSGSAILTVYFVGICAYWTLFIRPGDERECQRVFGRAFEAHYRSVRLWLPSRKPWSPPPSERPPISLDDLPDGYDQRRRRTN